jgi:hypothetical protein
MYERGLWVGGLRNVFDNLGLLDQEIVYKKDEIKLNLPCCSRNLEKQKLPQ